MSCFRLKSYEQSPPGSYLYEFSFKGQKRTLGPFPIIDDLAKALSNFRSANGFSRSGLRDCLLDVDHFQCTRLGNHRQFCVECDSQANVVAVAATAPLIAPPCRGCGAPVNQ